MTNANQGRAPALLIASTSQLMGSRRFCAYLHFIFSFFLESGLAIYHKYACCRLTLAQMANSSSTHHIPWAVISPYQNDTEALRWLESVPWVNSPSVRGTTDILRSCILTLLACVYTSIHLNVPDHSSWSNTLWSKIRWLLLALFLPEFVLFMAGDQLRQAWKLKKGLRKLQKEGEDGVRKDASKPQR